MTMTRTNWLEGFEGFAAPRFQLPGAPANIVTIGKTGQITIPPELAAKMFVGASDAWRVRFLHNPRTNQIAIITVEADELGAYKANWKDGRSAYVNGTRFLDALREEKVAVPSERTTYEATFHEEPRGIVFSL
jgi:hypothetical protein